MDVAMINSLIAMDSRLRTGFIHSSLNEVHLVDTANTLLLTAPDGHTLHLFCLMVYNRNATAVALTLGTGAALTQRVPRLGPFLTTYLDLVWLPFLVFESDIYVTSSAGAAAPTDVEVKAIAVAVGG